MSRTLPFLFAFLFSLCCSARNETREQAIELPVSVPEARWRPLRSQTDAELQRRLSSRLNRVKRWSALIRRNKMAVGLVDLSDPAAPRFAQVNGDTMMYAASLPKIAVLYAACGAFDDGTLAEKPEFIDDLTAMIRKSNNAAATRMIDRLGYGYIARAVTDPRVRLYDRTRGGGLWVGKRFAHTGRRYPEPLKNLVHAATATQVCRFYYLLATGRLISPQRSRQMLDILAHPALRHKFVHALDKLGETGEVYRKSGTWRMYHADSVLVWADDGRRYILVGLVEDRHGEKILRELLPVVEELLRTRPR